MLVAPDVLDMPPQRRLNDRRLRNNQEIQWIEQTFQKRDCIKYIPHDKQINKCMCGRLKLSHPVKPESAVRVTYPVHKWSATQHTEVSPTDAYGIIEFQGGPHPTKAQYIRLSYDTKPERVMQLLQQQWGLDLPKLLISVHGGIANFDLQPKLKRVCYRGLLQAAKTTGAWIVTGGTNTGVMKHVGDALGDTMVQARNNIVTIGIVSWGVVYKNEELIGKDMVKAYHANALPKGNSVVLNSNHSYFLMVDDGTVGQHGCEIRFRRRLEKYISQLKFVHASESNAKNCGTPVVCLMMEGGTNTIRSVLDCLTDQHPVPVVVCDGSGRAADLLAFTHKYTQEDGTMPENLRDQLLMTLMRTFRCSAEKAEQIFIELMMCIRKKHLITVFRFGEETNDIDLAILAALLKSASKSASDQLNLALSWNRVDVARSYIFVYGQEWSEGSLDQAMMDALVYDRVEFVKVLIENGVLPMKWLTIERLEELYNRGLTRVQPLKSKYITNVRQKNDPSSTLRFLLREYKKHVPTGYRYTLMDIGQVINRLMGGAYQSSYCRKKFRTIYYAVMRKTNDVSSAVASVVPNVVPVADPTALSSIFKYPYSELMVWAVLLRRQRMAKLMWQLGDENIAKALVAFKLYKSMAHEAEDDDMEVDSANELLSNAHEFEDLAVKLLEQCFKTNEAMTQLLLTYEMSNWSDQTCLSLAAAASHRPFVANASCQMLLTEMWMGGLRCRKYAFLKVIVGIVLFPSFLLLDYRSREELQLMPQTKEEHIQDLKESSSSDSDSGDDGESIKSGSSRGSARSERRRTKAPAAATTQVSTVQPSENIQLTTINSESPQSFPGTVMDSDLLVGKKSPLNFTKKVYEFYTAPITKFWMHTISFVIFLLIFIYTVLIRSLTMPEWNEWYIVAFMFGYALEKCREFVASEPTKLRQKCQVFFRDAWNVIDTFSIIIFFIGFFIRLDPDLVAHGRVYYCISVMFFIVRIIEYFDVSRRLGPFNFMIGKMTIQMFYFVIFLLVIIIAYGVFLRSVWYPEEEFSWNSVRDIFIKPYFNLYGETIQMLYFVIFLLVIIIAYGVFLRSVWYPDEEFDWDSVRDIFIKPYFNLYGEVYADEVWPECDPIGNDTANEFKCVPGRWMVPIVQTAFLVIGILLMFTLLIATFNAIFIRTNVISHLLWKFQRYKVVIEYEARPFLPPPLVIICHLYLVVKFIRRKCLHKRKFLDNGLKLFLSDEMIEQVHDFEEECVDAYFHESEEANKTCAEERIRLTTERLENVILRLDDIHQRENSIRDYLQAMDSVLTKLEEQTKINTTVLRSLESRCIIGNEINYPDTSSVPYSSLTSIVPDLPNISGDASGRKKIFNDQKLRPFTTHAKPSKPLQRGPSMLQRGLSIDAGEFGHLRAAGGRSRHYSLSVCENLELPVVKSVSVTAISDDENIDRRRQNHVSFKETPEYLSDRASSMSPVVTGASSASRPRTLNMVNFLPLTPIVTPNRIEYTSITDDIDTSSVQNNRSPPNTPVLDDSGDFSVTGLFKKPHRHHRQHRKHGKPKPEVVINDGLKTVEEAENQQMEVMMHRRMCELTLTETATMVNLAKHALETFEASSDESDKEGARHHSDDEVKVTNSNQLAVTGNKGLKSVRSEPMLKSKDSLEFSVPTVVSPRRPETPCKSDSSLGSEPGIQFVASSADSFTEGAAKNLSLC